ncbi:MAG: hypothetical protein IPJ88_06380 [Myxococcales bacterium]|nr:MAG: hypothetical protein IPJ88_06380 [Myxococcales bacterium]
MITIGDHDGDCPICQALKANGPSVGKNFGPQLDMVSVSPEEAADMVALMDMVNKKYLD